MKPFVASIAFVAFVALACSKQEPPAPAEMTEPSAAPAPTIASAAPAEAAPTASAAAEAEPATEEDFEDEATKSVTATTLDSQLDALEKEIQAD
jgi:hypothetical protein